MFALCVAGSCTNQKILKRDFNFFIMILMFIGYTYIKRNKNKNNIPKYTYNLHLRERELKWIQILTYRIWFSNF